MWRGRPSHWTAAHLYVFCTLFCFLVIPAIVGLSRFITISTTRWEFTTQRLRKKSGWLSTRIDEVELFRIKDSRVERSLVHRIFGLGKVTLITSDRTTPTVEIDGIHKPIDLREMIRNLADAERRRRGVKEIDME